MKLSGSVVLLCAMMLVLSGCWGRSELKDVAIVSGVAVQQKGEDFEVSTETIKLGTAEEKISSNVVVSSKGKSVFDAVRNLIIPLGKKQIWQHVDAFIIGEKMAKSGISPIIDFMLRDHEPRFRLYLLVSKGDPKSILNIKSETGKINGALIKKALEEQKFLSKAPQIQLHSFAEMLINPFRDPYLPIIKKGGQGFEISGTAIFRKDRMVGQLTPFETRGLLRLLGKIKGGLQVVRMGTTKSGKPIYVTIEIKKAKTKMKVKFENGMPTVHIHIHETGFVGSLTHSIPRDELDQKNLDRIEKLYADAIEREAAKTAELIQHKFKSNVLGFPDLINRADKRYWQRHKKEWNKIYPRVKLVITAKTHIPENGLIINNVGD